MHSVAGVTLSETSLNFRRYEQWFYSSEGADIHQLRFISGAGYAAYSFQGTEIQKRSYPNSVGRHQGTEGWEFVERYDLKLQSFRPIDPPDKLWETEPDRCCHIRKVEPLERALASYDAWITGIRREQALTRANAQKVEWSERYGVWKVQPIVDWDAKRVQAYIHVNEIPYNPLHDRGYPSIGCIPCTRAVVAGEDERAGRWTGSDKLECGIHINAPLIKESND